MTTIDLLLTFLMTICNILSVSCGGGVSLLNRSSFTVIMGPTLWDGIPLPVCGDQSEDSREFKSLL